MSPNQKHLNAVIRIFQYLKHTRTFGLCYSNSTDRQMVIFTDADYLRLGVRKPTSGVIVMFGGCVVHWIATRQEGYRGSTAEAEISALHLGYCEAMYWRKFLMEIGCSREAIKLCTDNVSALAFAANVNNTHAAHALPSKFFQIREAVVASSITVEKVDTRSNIADLMTKPIKEKYLFEHLRTLCGVVDCAP